MNFWKRLFPAPETGPDGKPRVTLKERLDALRMLPKILRKRSAVRRMARLSGAEVKQLILDHRIDLRELTTQAAIR